jgi:DNA-binding NarL/FixJ family response regulator
MYKILIVEDNLILANGVVRFLSGHLSSTEIHIAASGRDCLSMLQQNVYDIVLLDIRLPDISGQQLCRIIHSVNPGIKIIALTGMMETSMVNNMKNAGASGYILKTAITDELPEGIEAVMRGEIYVSRDAQLSD